MHRLCHGYGFTRGVPKTGIAGTGTVCHFGTPQYTAYPYRGVTGIHGLMYTIGGFIILIIMYLQMSYLSFDAEICDRAEFKTPLNVVFETRPFLLLLVLGYQAAGARQLKGPCSLVSPRCATKAQRSDGGWMGRDKESWRLRAGGAKSGASSLTNITIYINYIVFSPFRTPQAYAWWSYSSPVKNQALVAWFCA